MFSFRKRKKEREILDVTNGPILKKMVMFAVPLIISGILQQTFNTADSIVVGQVNTAALGGVSATGSIINLIINLFLGLSVGASVAISQSIGARDERRAASIAHTSIAAAVLSGIVVAAIGISIASPVLRMMDTPKENIDFAITYMRIFFIGVPFMLIYNYGSAILRTVGDTKRPAIYLAIGGFINVLLNILFVIILRFNPAGGVAAATVISNFISSTLVMITLCKSSNCCKIYICEIKINKHNLIHITKIGLPAGIQGSLFSISNILMQSSINSFGHTFVEGNGASISLEGYAAFMYDGFSQAATTFGGQNFGAKRYDRLKKIYGCAMLCGAAIMSVIAAVVIIMFRRPLVELFIPNGGPAIDVGCTRIECLMSTQIICAAMSITGAILKGINKSFSSMIVMVFGVCVVRIIWVYTIFEWYKNIFVLYAIYPISWAITLAALMVLFFRTCSRLNKTGA